MTRHFFSLRSTSSTKACISIRNQKNSVLKSAGLLLFLVAFLAPTVSSAQSSQGFSRQGIFGCNRNNAALSGSVGAFSATGGVYVPVADYTVELNTGTLVYQQCVLRGIVDREAESVASGIIQKIEQYIDKGRDGGRLYAIDRRAEKVETGNERALPVMNLLNSTQDATSKATGGKMTQVIARRYLLDQHPITRDQCPYKKNLIDCWEGRDPSKECEDAQINTRCIPQWALYERKNDLYDEVAAAEQDQQDCLNWGRGFYCKDHLDANGQRIIETPSSVVAELNNQAVTSGLRKIENANDVDQMVGALYAGLGAQVLTGTGGLSGLTKAIGNQPSYLSQLTAESSAGLRSAAANAALQILAGARQVESQYNSVVTSMANTLTGAIGQIRSVENQCWSLIAYNTTALHVCTDAPTGSTCKDAAGNNIRIATSTAFSQPLIDTQIKPLATQVVANVQKSQQALALIDQLIAGVANTGSADAQRLALVQLDQMVSQGKLHVSADVTAAQGQKTAITDSMSTLVDSTKKFWADNTTLNVSTGSGWCNVQQQGVIDAWDQRWR